MRNGKYRLAAIIICVLVCIIGISYYVKGYSKTEAKETDKKITTVKGIENCAFKKECEYEQLRKNINEINDVDKVLYSFNSNKILLLKNNKIMLEEADKKLAKDLKNINDSVKIMSSSGNDEYAAWLETTEIKKGYQVINKNTMYLYDVKNNNIKKIAESSFIKNQNNIYSNNYDIGCNFKIKGSKVIYICYEYEGYKLKDQYLKEYDINSGDQKVLYKQSFKKNNSYFYLYNFDLDYDRSYLAFCIKYYGDLKGYALMECNIGKGGSKLLAVSENEISPTVNYPYMSFQVGNDVHLYNIEMKDDAFSYKSQRNISGVKMAGNQVFWDSDKIYCYSLRYKKIYIINDEKYNNKSYVTGKALCWGNGKCIRYIDIE